jgi:uncharacterized protein (TIGR03083 family)
MSADADRAISVMRTVSDRIAGRVAKMGPEELAAPSGAVEWTVAQVLSHLGSGAEVMLATVDGAVDGSGAPAGEFAPEVWGRWNAMTPAEQAEQFLKAGEALVARFEGFDEAARANLKIALGLLPQPVDVATAVGLRISELTFHGWDVEVAFNREATLAPEAVELVFAPMEMFLGYFAKADVIQSARPLTLSIELTEPRKSFGLVLGPKVTLLEDTPAEVAGVVKGPAEAWLRLLAGRLGAEVTPENFTVYGGAVTLPDLRKVFPGY